MPAYSDFDWGQKEDQQPSSGLYNDFDWSDDTTPSQTATPATVSQETVEDVTRKPVGRPAGSGQEAPVEEPQEPSVVPVLQEKQKTAEESVQQLGLNPLMFGTTPKQAPKTAQQEMLDTLKTDVSPEAKAQYQDWYKEEGLPAAGMLLGTLAAPEVAAGYGFWAALGAGALVTGAGATVGEAAEQTAKYEGIMPLAKEETAPKDGWDILERSAFKGGKEAAYDLAGGLLLRGITHYGSELAFKATRPRKLADGTVVDQGKEDLVNAMMKHVEETGEGEGTVLLASQPASVAHYKMLEDMAKNSYVAADTVDKVLAKQGEVLTGQAKELVGGLKEGAQAKVMNADDSMGVYFKTNMDNNNDFVVAGLVRKSFTDAQNQRKSVARSMYSAMDEVANKTEVSQIMEETPTGLFGLDGRPLTVLTPVTKEVNQFPVQLQEVREWASDIVDESLLKTDPVLGELMEFPEEGSMKQVGEVLSELKGRSRQLQDGIKMGTAAENAPKRKLLIDKAVDMLNGTYENTLKATEDAGVLMPDGQTLREWKGQADTIWAKQIEDFQNDAILNIMKNTDLVNGTPDALANLFIKDSSHADKILNVLNQGKANLKGEQLETLKRTEEMIKGTLIEKVLLPMDHTTKKYGAPDEALFERSGQQLKMLLGDETYESVRELVSASAEHTRAMNLSTQAYAQKARESGATLDSINKGMTGDASAVVKLSSTLLIAFGGGKVLTNPKNVRLAMSLDKPGVSAAYKRRTFRYLSNEYAKYISSQEATMDDAKKAQLEAKKQYHKEEDEKWNAINNQ